MPPPKRSVPGSALGLQRILNGPSHESLIGVFLHKKSFEASEPLTDWLLQYLSGREGRLAPALVFLSMSKNERAGARAGSPAGQPRWGAKPPFLTLRGSQHSLLTNFLCKGYRNLT
jgi:hypothetical protein